MTKIRNRFTNKVIIEDDKLSLKELVEKAVKEGVSLADAYLQDANLEGANLEGADLRWANLQWANLAGANLWGANLRDAGIWRADLRGAIISEEQLPSLINSIGLIIKE